MAGNGQTVIELDKKRMTASASKDFDTLNQLIGDDLIFFAFVIDFLESLLVSRDIVHQLAVFVENVLSIRH